MSNNLTTFLTRSLPWQSLWLMGCGVGIIGGALALGHLYWDLGLLPELLVSLLPLVASVTLFWLVLGLPLWRSRLVALGLVGLAVLTAVQLTLVTSGTSPDTSAHPRGVPLRLATVNLLSPNSRSAELLDWLQKSRFQLIAWVEFNETWGERLAAAIGEQFPYRYELPRPDNFGLAIWSRYPLQDCKSWDVGEAGAVPAMVCGLLMADRLTRVVAIHPWPPKTAGALRWRNQYLKVLVERLQQEDSPLLILGDANAVPWSRTLRAVTEQLELKLVGTALGAQPTWPAGLPKWLRIPIDHILFSAHFNLRHSFVSPYFGSDHRGLGAVLNLRDLPPTKKDQP